MSDLTTRLRVYGEVLDRAADAASPAGPGHPGPLRLVDLDEGRSRRRLVAVAAAAVLVVGAVAGLAVTTAGDDTDVVAGGSPTAGPDLDPSAQPEAPAPEAHSDMDGCMDSQGPPVVTDVEATQNRWERCLWALEGEIIAAGEVGGEPWELVASSEPTGDWVSLRARGSQGIFRSQTTTSNSANIPVFLEIGACCTLGDTTFVTVVANEDVARVRVLRGGSVVGDARSVTSGTGGVTFAVVPVTGTPGTVDVEFERTDGSRFVPVEGGIDLGNVGG